MFPLVLCYLPCQGVQRMHLLYDRGDRGCNIVVSRGSFLGSFPGFVGPVGTHSSQVLVGNTRDREES